MLTLILFSMPARRHEARHPAQGDYRRFCSSLLHQELLHLSGANVWPRWAPHQTLSLGHGVFFPFATILLHMRNYNLVPDVTFLSLF